MKEYHKIETCFVRDEKTHKVIPGQWRTPEFAYLADNLWTWTEKVDGTNIRVRYGAVDKGVSFGGKTDNAQIPAPLIKVLQDMFPVEKMVSAFDTSVCLYGEGYGAKIQKGGGNYRQDQSFVLFDVRVGDWWLRRKDVEDIAAKFGIQCVPIVGIGSLNCAWGMVASGFKSAWGNFPAEGLVCRPVEELQTRAGHRIIAKIKTRDF